MDDNPAAHPDAESSDARLDKWLWAIRVFKTRPLATEACRRGAVEINGLAAKPARSVHPGEIVVVKQPLLTRSFQVLGSPPSRIGAKLVREFCTELTPPAEFARQRERGLSQILARPKGSGRPTKRDRRSIDSFFN